MIGKAHSKSFLSCAHCNGCPSCLPSSIKHSIASTALSGSNAHSVMMLRQNTDPKNENARVNPNLGRVLSTSSILETAIKALDKLAKRNKKSHLLLKYAELKEKYSIMIENSVTKGTANKQSGSGERSDLPSTVAEQQRDKQQVRTKKRKMQTLPEVRQNPGKDYVQFCSQKGREIFLILKYISQGVSGKVYLVRQYCHYFRHLATGCIFSLKVIPKSKIGPLNLHQMVRELKIQSFLNHPNIVKLYHFHIDTTNIYLLLEPCLASDLYKSIKQHRQGLPERKVKDIVKQVCQAVEYMHKRSIIHRDIKPQNILLHEDIVKICDFGWAVYSPLLRETRCGTPLYASPEMVRAESYDCKIDVWNIGVLTYELIYGNIPFQIRQVSDLSKIIEQEVYFSCRATVSEYAKDFIGGCLEKHPSKRFSIRQAIDHQFLIHMEKYRWTVV